MKTKKLRQRWFNNLSEEDKKAFIDKKIEEKAQKRAEKSKLFRGTDRFNCLSCIHYKTGSCEDWQADKVCNWFDNPEDSIKGLNYKDKPVEQLLFN
jgi:hypothetical protein